jgi:hypothetical protein
MTTTELSLATTTWCLSGIPLLIMVILEVVLGGKNCFLSILVGEEVVAVFFLFVYVLERVVLDGKGVDINFLVLLIILTLIQSLTAEFLMYPSSHSSSLQTVLFILVHACKVFLPSHCGHGSQADMLESSE